MGFGGGSTEKTLFNPTNPLAQGATKGAGNFFEQLFQGGVAANPFAQTGQTGLAGQSGNAISTFMGQQNPQLRTFNQGIENFFQGGMPAGPSAQTFNFNPNVNAFGGGANAGALGAAGQAISALQPGRAAQQQSALGALSNAAGNRFSTAFNQQGIDLMSQLNQQNAAQDAGIINQAQGLNLQQALGQNQLGLQAAGQNFGNALQSGLFQQQNRQNLFGNLLGASQNAFNQGQGQFQNLLGAGQFGLQQNMAGIDPFLQLLGMGTQFAQPQPLEMLVQQRQGGGLGGFLGTLAGGALGSFGGPLLGAAGANLGNRLFGGK